MKIEFKCSNVKCDKVFSIYTESVSFYLYYDCVCGKKDSFGFSVDSNKKLGGKL